MKRVQSVADVDLKNILESCTRLRHWIEEQNYAGWDPYDALNSPILKAASLDRKWLRIFMIQVIKRSPVNLRPLLGIRKGHNPKGLGLFLWGYAKLCAATGDESARRQAYHVLELIENCKGDTAHGNGWGYNFDWQSRAFYVPKGTPTIVNSAFIGHALLDAYELIGEEKFLRMALPIRAFILNDLHRTPAENGAFCFSYTPIDHLTVHNANLLGASLLIRLEQYDASSCGRDAALAALTYSMDRQRPDGSWWYADTNYQKWIDSFHTGFNLQSIRWFLQSGEAEEYKKDYERGVEYYAKNFFEPDGTAKYFHDRTLPEDIHSYAQAVVFYSSEGDAYRGLVERITDTMINRFQTSEGWFCFQRRRGRPIRIPYIRWGQAWAFHGLTEYLLNRAD